MKKLTMNHMHREKLSEYGLQQIPQEACFGLHFSLGEQILREGDPIFWLLIIVNGSAKICRTAPNGKSLILCYYDASSGMIGEIELMTKQDFSTSTVYAMTDLECVAINIHTCISELKTNVFFLNKLGNGLAEKLSKSADNYTSSALCSGEQRLCAYILEASNRNLFRDTLTDVSSLIGLSYRHLCRLLGQLCEEKVLEKRDSGYYILDCEELRRRSQTTPIGRQKI